MKKDINILSDKIKKFVGKNYQAGDEYTIEDAARAILKCEELYARIAKEGDLVEGYNHTKYKNPLYDVAKLWDSKKMASLTALGLTPYARKRLVGTAEGEQPKSDITTGRKAQKSKLKTAEESEEEFC